MSGASEGRAEIVLADLGLPIAVTKFLVLPQYH